MNSSDLLRFLKLKKSPAILDGAMGTLLADKGWSPPALPEEMNFTAPEVVEAIHRSYRDAGAEIIETNTFGGSPVKLAARRLDGRAREINEQAARLAKAAAGSGVLVAGAIGPLGELLAPFGSLTFDDAKKAFREQAEGLAAGGADFFLIETMLDLREAKAAVLAVKEAAPGTAFVVSFTFDRLGRTVTGTPPEVAARWAFLVGASGVGANCGVGPAAYIETVKILAAHGGLPVFVYANGGLPGDGDYIAPEPFAQLGRELAEAGAAVVGGCCGTTPEHTRALRKALDGRQVAPFAPTEGVPLASRSRLVLAGKGRPFLVIGERINVSRKSPLRDEIARGQWAALREEARRQTSAGAMVLDVNVGLPTIDQEKAMETAVTIAEQSSELPLSIDSDSRTVLEAGLAAVTGIPLINSFTAKENSLYPGLALAKLHGAVAAILPMDEKGLPESAEERIAVIRRVLAAADSLSFPRNALVVDGLTMATGADMKAPAVTLEVLKFLADEGITSMLGVSNISHGMPARPLLNRTFLAMAMASGLGAAIMDPLDTPMMESVAAAALLTGRDPMGTRYISLSKKFSAPSKDEGQPADGLPEGPFNALGLAVLQGDKPRAESVAEGLLDGGTVPLTLVNEGVVPALEVVGRKYDSGEFFLPQLIASAEAAQGVCGMAMALLSAADEKPRGRILLATVEGDLHDLGKNVLGTILKSHGYVVKDLGKDVPIQVILEEAGREPYDVIGLSALMTSTMKTMGTTVSAIREEFPDVIVLVGGASVSDQFARSIGAHGFAPDAVSTVRMVESFLGQKSKREE